MSNRVLQEDPEPFVATVLVAGAVLLAYALVVLLLVLLVCSVCF